MTDESDFRYHFNCDHSHCAEIDNLMQSQMEQISAGGTDPAAGNGGSRTGSRRNRSRPRRSFRGHANGSGSTDHAINISEQPPHHANWENHPSRRNSIVEIGPGVGVIAGLDDFLTQGRDSNKTKVGKIYFLKH